MPRARQIAAAGALLLASVLAPAVHAETYSDILGLPAGRIVQTSGKVQQVIEGWPTYQIRVAITFKGYDIWTDTVWVQYEDDTARPDQARIATGDIVSLFGRVAGHKIFKTVLGVERTEPLIVACHLVIEKSPFRYQGKPCPPGPVN